MTDEAGQNRKFGEHFARHEMVNHRIDEYVRGDTHTNTIEGYFSILKRGVIGTYRHVSKQHLARYLGEFDFRYNNRVALGRGRFRPHRRGAGWHQGQTVDVLTRH
jgi:hypothetical protein